MPTTVTPPAGPDSLQRVVAAVLTERAAPTTLRARVAVDLIEAHVVEQYPEVLELPRARRWLVPSHLIHPSLRALA
jgi:hypothetical protein